jgi:hypothetical protein
MKGNVTPKGSKRCLKRVNIHTIPRVMAPCPAQAVCKKDKSLYLFLAYYNIKFEFVNLFSRNFAVFLILPGCGT